MVARGGRGGRGGHLVSGRKDENFWNQIVLIVAQLQIYQKLELCA